MKTEIVDERENGELHVQLRWNRRSARVYVVVRNRATDEVLLFAPDAERALDAFHHPFGYVASATEGLLAA
jgi:hypothetical protein